MANFLLWNIYKMIISLQNVFGLNTYNVCVPCIIHTVGGQMSPQG